LDKKVGFKFSFKRFYTRGRSNFERDFDPNTRRHAAESMLVKFRGASRHSKKLLARGAQGASGEV